MIGTDEAQTSTQRVSEILIDLASQFFLAVVVGLVMAVVANMFVEGARMASCLRGRSYTCSR